MEIIFFTCGLGSRKRQKKNSKKKKKEEEEEEEEAKAKAKSKKAMIALFPHTLLFILVEELAKEFPME